MFLLLFVREFDDRAKRASRTRSRPNRQIRCIVGISTRAICSCTRTAGVCRALSVYIRVRAELLVCSKV